MTHTHTHTHAVRQTHMCISRACTVTHKRVGGNWGGQRQREGQRGEVQALTGSKCEQDSFVPTIETQKKTKKNTKIEEKSKEEEEQHEAERRKKRQK